jgi:hypothetical protein
MGTIDVNAARKRRVAWAVVGGVVALGAVACLAAFLGRPPQMGADEEVFTTVDALYTAVTARDERLVAQCEARLRDARAEGKLPPDAAAYLNDVIARARGGRWESAAQRLYDFMKVQKREGRRSHRHGKQPRDQAPKK